MLRFPENKNCTMFSKYIQGFKLNKLKFHCRCFLHLSHGSQFAQRLSLFVLIDYGLFFLERYCNHQLRYSPYSSCTSQCTQRHSGNSNRFVSHMSDMATPKKWDDTQGLCSSRSPLQSGAQSDRTPVSPRKSSPIAADSLKQAVKKRRLQNTHKTQNKHKATHDQLIKTKLPLRGGVTFTASVVQLAKALIRLSFCFSFFWHTRTSIHMLTRKRFGPAEVV